MKILDMCCGSKMFWYEKYEPHTTYMDIRKDTYTTMDRGKERKIEIAPDIQADFTDMPFADNTFDLFLSYIHVISNILYHISPIFLYLLP